MNRAQKAATLEALRPLFEGVHFYILDAHGLNAQQSYALRKAFFQAGIICKMVPNALLALLLPRKEAEGLSVVLKQSSLVLLTKGSPSQPAKIIEDFRKRTKVEQPILKGAWVYEEVFVGNEQMPALAKIRSKEELLGDLMLLLEQPMQNLVGVLQCSQNKLCGALEKLGARS